MPTSSSGTLAGITMAERQSALDHFPPVLYLPAVRDGGQTQVELLELRGGKIGLLVFTSLDRLARCLGSQQPWILAQTGVLLTPGEGIDYDELFVDIPFPTDNRAGS